MRHLNLLLWGLLAPFIALSQDCGCPETLQWLKSTFEQNDAGFTYAIEAKGEEAYRAHHAAIEARANTADGVEACTGLLEEWLGFFRSGHIGIFAMDPGSNDAAAADESDEAIRRRFADWESHEVDLEAFKKDLHSKSDPGPEGSWESPPYRIGVKRVGEEFVGFVIEADGVYWQPGQVKFRIPAEGKIVYYMRDHSPRYLDGYQMLGKNFMTMGFVQLRRSFPVYETEPALERYLDLVQAQGPSLRRLSEEALLLRIPDFSGSQKRAIDSLLRTNHETIINTPRLVIDLRGNTGGSDYSYENIIPYLYTNPIRTVGVEFLSTELNNARMLQFMEDPDFPESEKEWANEAYQRLQEKMGTFVNLEEEVVSLTTHDQIYFQPERVSILIDDNCASTTEQFLLAAKQSSKVKLYGTTTFGALDISNMNVAISPCQQYQLAYCLSRSMRIPQLTIDEKGIQPDYFIDRSVPPYQWLDFVLER